MNEVTINSRAKQSKQVNEKTLVVAVDIGKFINTGYCRCPDRSETKVFEFFNTGRGFHEFYNRIELVKRQHQLEEIVVGFESTGCYGEPLMHFLNKRTVKLVQVNPMHTKKLKELQGNSPTKTDHKDPKVIADIICLGHALEVIIPEGATAQLRRLTQARERALQRRNGLLNQIHDLVFVLFPEFLQVMKNVTSKSSRVLLKQLPTAEAIKEYGLEPLTTFLRKISRGKLGRERARTLREAACESAGLQEGKASMVLEMQHLLEMVESSDQFIADLEKQMSASLGEIPYVKYLLSVKGIGEITSAGLIGEVGDFRRYHTLAEVMKLAGLDLFEISSGIHKGQRHISKRGRPLLRKLLFFSAINVVRQGGILHQRYQQYLQTGMVKMKALIAIARKLLGILFALVRDQKEYIHGYVNTQPVTLVA
jgi:transposase